MHVNNDNSSQTSPRRRTTQVVAAFALVPLVTVLAACGGSSSGTPLAQAPTPAPTQAQNQAPDSGGQGGTGGPGGQGAFPGASGLIAAASPGTLQVQSSTAQNTVVYNAATKFTQVLPGHVVVGDCVIVTGTPAAGSTQGLTATSARIVGKVNGSCATTGTNGAGLPGGRQFPGRPPGAPNGGSGTRRAFASATGMVSSVTGTTVLVKGTLRNGPGAASTATPATPSTITVNLPASATVTQTVPATSAAAVVGQCARAIGPANSVGAITAKSITISKPGANGCRTGFGGRFNGGGTNGTGTGNAAGSNA
jgi:hypothetical protein